MSLEGDKRDCGLKFSYLLFMGYQLVLENSAVRAYYVIARQLAVTFLRSYAKNFKAHC